MLNFGFGVEPWHENAEHIDRLDCNWIGKCRRKTHIGLWVLTLPSPPPLEIREFNAVPGQTKLIHHAIQYRAFAVVPYLTYTVS